MKMSSLGTCPWTFGSFFHGLGEYESYIGGELVGGIMLWSIVWHCRYDYGVLATIDSERAFCTYQTYLVAIN